MSLGAEILTQVAARRLARGSPSGLVAVLSRYGYGALAAGASAAVAPLAFAPRGGLCRRPVSIFAPPAPIDGAEAAAILRHAPLIADLRDAPERGGVRAALSAAPAAPALLRIRLGDAGAFGADLDGLNRIFACEIAAEAVYAAPDLALDDVLAKLDPDQQAFVDEFEALTVSRARGALRGRRFTGRGMELSIDPVTCVVAPEREQIDTAIATGAATASAAGRLRLAIPAFAPGGSRWTAALRVDRARAVESNIGLRRDGPFIRIDGVTPAGEEAGFAALHCDGPAVLEEVWVTVTRRRGRWEVWDEANAQLQLEESW